MSKDESNWIKSGTDYNRRNLIKYIAAAAVGKRLSDIAKPNEDSDYLEREIQELENYLRWEYLDDKDVEPLKEEVGMFSRVNDHNYFSFKGEELEVNTYLVLNDYYEDEANLIQALEEPVSEIAGTINNNLSEYEEGDSNLNSYIGDVNVTINLLESGGASKVMFGLVKWDFPVDSSADRESLREDFNQNSSFNSILES